MLEVDSILRKELRLVTHLRTAILEREKLDCRPRDIHLYPKGTTIQNYDNESELRLSLQLDDEKVQGTTENDPLLVVYSPSTLLPPQVVGWQEQGRPPRSHPNITELDREMNRKLDLVIEATRKADRATPQYSAAIIGNRAKARLKKENQFVVFHEQPGEDAILSADDLNTLSNMGSEHQVVAFVVPYVQKVFDTLPFKCSVYNSEEYKWIETSSETSAYNEKPDLIVCHPAIISKKPPFNSKDPALKSMREEYPYEYGVLSEWKLRDAIGLTCEAKICIDNRGFGEVINYGAHLCYGKHGSIATRLILFDKKECWLVHMVKGTAATVTTFQWQDQGGANLLRTFVRQPGLTMLLEEACRHFKLTVGNDSFLGAGAFGFVFRATRLHDGKCVALKIVLENGNQKNLVRLANEHWLICEAHRKCPELVMGVEADGFATLEQGAVMLLSEVGEHYSKLDPQDIVESLKALHRNGIVHGDARPENVVCVNEKPVWIDFSDSFLPPVELPGQKAMELDLLRDCLAKRFDGYNGC